MKTIHTKLNQVIKTTSSLAEMEGMYLSEHLLRKWSEEFIDEDTGEVVPVERNEIILERGTFLGPDQCAVINFHMQTGDVSEVKCTDQPRTTVLTEAYNVSPWCVTISLAGKKMKFLLLARTITQAIDIVCDYAEIHFSKTWFSLVSAKGFKDHIFLYNTPLLEKDEGENKEVVHSYVFYSIWAMLHFGEDMPDQEFPFLVYAKDVEDARVHIFNYLSQCIADNGSRVRLGNLDLAVRCSQITMEIRSATVVKCAAVIPHEYTQAYNPHLYKDGEE